MKIKAVKFSTILFLLAGVILLAVMITMLGGSQPETSSPGPAWVARDIQALESTLSVSQNPTEQAFIQSKLDRLKSIQANSLQGLNNVPEKPADKCGLRPTPLPTEIPTPGVEQFPAELYEQYNLFANSRWQGDTNGQWAVVLAGYLRDDPQQGVLLVLVPNTDDQGVYPAPQAGGALQITAADGARLILVDDAGANFSFDIAARAYLSSPDQVLPTLAPHPTFTPTTDICAP